jgi:hypothetical protein
MTKRAKRLSIKVARRIHRQGSTSRIRKEEGFGIDKYKESKKKGPNE